LHGQNPAFSWGYDDSEAGQERTFGKAGLDRRKNDRMDGRERDGKVSLLVVTRQLASEPLSVLGLSLQARLWS
jgi:hypothetical protein